MAALSTILVLGFGVNTKNAEPLEFPVPATVQCHAVKKLTFSSYTQAAQHSEKLNFLRTLQNVEVGTKGYCAKRGKVKQLSRKFASK